MPLRCTTELPARTSRLRMSISISPSLIVGTIGRSIPVARRVMTIERASSSSGEKGIVRMSSTPSSNALSFDLRSPRRVSPRIGVTLRVSVFETAEQGGAVVVVHVDHGHVRVPLGEDRLGLCQAARSPNDKEAVIQRQLDEVHDQLAIVEHEGATRLLPRCIDLAGCHGSSSLGPRLPRSCPHLGPWLDGGASSTSRYPKIVVTMRPMDATPITIVVTHPTTLSRRPLVRSPIAARLFETSMTRTMSGAAMRPLSTALRTRAVIGLMPRKLMAIPTSVAATITT